MENLTSSTFEKTIEDNSMLIIDFWAPWCGPCRSFGPIFEKVSKNHTNVLFAKINVDEEQELAAAFGVRSIPTVCAIKNKNVVFINPGMLRESDLEELAGKLIEFEVQSSVERTS